MRSLIVVRRADLAIFDEAFDRFFGGGLVGGDFERRGQSFDLPGGDEPMRIDTPVLLDRDALSDGVEAEQVEEVVGGSYVERIAGRDFADLDPQEAEEVRRLLAQMVWRPADSRSRRWQASSAGDRPDLRRTFRAMRRPEGDLLPLAFRARRRRKRPLLVVADISGSMERYTEMFMHFIHGAQGRLGRVEAFVFGTRLTRITREMRRRSPSDALAGVASVVEDWSGGTRIGESLQRFNQDWSRRVTGGGPVALLISDGWDTGDPELLEREMARFARSVHRVVWLNPLAGRTGYRPETRGMVAVLPYIDDFLPAASILDLRHVVQLLESVPSQSRGLARV
jgi:uncharacterized protein with von Willebrand factor type A (vWA) domain